MANWWVSKSISFRAKPEGKGIQEKSVDLTCPTKSLEELETKIGIKCPDDKRKELLTELESLTGSNQPSWLGNVTIPEWYSTANSQDVMNALQWGYELVRDQEKMSENKLNEKLDLEWKKRYEVLSGTCKKISEEANKIREETANEISNIKQEAEQRLSIKDKILQDMQKTLNDAVNEQVKNATSEYKRQLEEKENDKKNYWEQLTKLQEQLKESNDKKAKNNISANKGKEGENKLETLLRDAFYGATITPTYNIPGQMDMHLTLGTTKIMIDAKNHEREIKRDDVEKFKTDLHSNDESSVGILIGLNLNIPKHNSHFIETRIVNNKLEIYMNQLLLGNAIERLRMLSGIIEIWDQYIKVSYTKNSELDVDKFKEWETNARRTLNNSLALIIALNTTWTDTKKSIEKSMDGFSKSLSNLIEETKNDLIKLDIFPTEEVSEPAIDSKPKRSSKKQSLSQVSK
jgi:hypothetical protein